MRTTTAMAAELSDVPKRTIQRWAAEGRITSEIRAGKVYVNAAEVEQLAEHRHAGRLPRNLTGDQLVAHSAHSVPVVSAGAMRRSSTDR